MECIICLDLLDDPVFCSDGFVYCRYCIGKWVQMYGIPWKSPSSNLEIMSPAILVSDFRRSALVREMRREILQDKLKQAPDVQSKFELLAFTCDSNTHVSTADQEIRALSSCRTDVDPMLVLELSYRNGMCPKMNDTELKFILDEDARNYAHARIRIEVLRHLMKRNNQKELRDHVERRLKIPDAIRIDRQILQEIGSNSDSHVYCIREDERDRVVTFRNTAEDISVLIPLDPGFVGICESPPQLELRVTTNTHFFKMDTTVGHSFMDRIYEQPVFPDSDGLDLIFGNEYDANMTIFEKLPALLPRFFEYHPRYVSEGSLLRARIFVLECQVKRRRVAGDV